MSSSSFHLFPPRSPNFHRILSETAPKHLQSMALAFPPHLSNIAPLSQSLLQDPPKLLPLHPCHSPLSPNFFSLPMSAFTVYSPSHPPLSRAGPGSSPRSAPRGPLPPRPGRLRPNSPGASPSPILRPPTAARSLPRVSSGPLSPPFLRAPSFSLFLPAPIPLSRAPSLRRPLSCASRRTRRPARPPARPPAARRRAGASGQNAFVGGWPRGGLGARGTSGGRVGGRGPRWGRECGRRRAARRGRAARSGRAGGECEEPIGAARGARHGGHPPGVPGPPPPPPRQQRLKPRSEEGGEWPPPSPGGAGARLHSQPASRPEPLAGKVCCRPPGPPRFGPGLPAPTPAAPPPAAASICYFPGRVPSLRARPGPRLGVQGVGPPGGETRARESRAQEVGGCLGRRADGAERRQDQSLKGRNAEVETWRR